MLKFIKHHMETIVGIEIFPMISLVIFVLFFTALLIVVVKMDKKMVQEMSNIPIDKNESDHENE